MSTIPKPVFEDLLSKISWKKIYEREYGVQYSEVAISVLAFLSTHFPFTSSLAIVIPGAPGNTAFYIDSQSWIQLVEGLNNKYTSRVDSLEKYEEQFNIDGKNYLQTAKKIGTMDLKTVSNKELLSIFLDYQEKRLKYSAFIWSAFILNNYVADRATVILDKYLKKRKRENEKQDVVDSLFSPHKRAAILELQHIVESHKGSLSKSEINELYEKYKWLSCLDIHNKEWTHEEFKKQIETFTNSSPKKITPFEHYEKELNFEEKDLEYLHMAKRFIYIKDARDDFRREGVYCSQNLFHEIGKRIEVSQADTSYLQEQEIIDFLSGKKIDPQIIEERKNGFVLYLSQQNVFTCLQGGQITSALRVLNLQDDVEEKVTVAGRVASQGKTKGKVRIVQGVKDLHKVKVGDVLVAVTTHPDFVSAMRKAVAIITDEGGITSHAAIVSREFGIPCIVGCGNATKLLKDGDLVEVDAIEGKVTKIS